MKVIIAGGRNFDDYELLRYKCDFYLRNVEDKIEIVSGDARGADFCGNKYAIERGYDIKHFPADWFNNGKAAGPIRNKQMAQYADYLIAFWDGKSKGTKSMIDLATIIGLPVRIVKYITP